MNKVKTRIFLSPPHMSGGEKKYIEDAFRQNWVAPLGPNVDAFEKSLAEYCNTGHAAVLSSGTAALHLALILLGVKTGDEVIVSTFTFSASVNPIVYLGATPVFVDSEPGTWNMDPDLLEQAIIDRISHYSSLTTPRLPKAIIVVHLYGMPANMDRIMEIADRYEIPVIEDAAEALGSRFKGKHVGTFGRMGILSFNGNKIITTSGGGALISDYKDLIEKARFLATQARDKAPHYQHSQIGYNYRMSNILAGIGRGQMEVIDCRVERKREIFNYYRNSLREIEGIRVLEEPDRSYFSNFWLTTILVDKVVTGISREKLQEALEVENIESRPLWKPMHLQPVFEAYPAFLNGISESLFTYGICLPSGTSMSDDDLKRVLNVLKRELKK